MWNDGERRGTRMKRLLGFAIVLLLLVIALSLGITFAENAVVSKEKVNATKMEIANNKTMDIIELNNVTKDLENVTQSRNITGLQNVTEVRQNNTTTMQDAANPFANVRGKTPKPPPPKP